MASSLAQEHVFESSTEDSGTVVSPKRIGRFEIVEELGKGSMGVVYLARDPVIGRWVAVKQLTGIKGKALNPETVRRLLINEARNVGALEHPGILTVFDVVEDQNGCVEALAMEFIRGKSLRQRLDNREPISLKLVSEVMSAVADALDYAHECGCIHRDVKPANILLGHDGSIKIADFGIAALRGEDLATELRNLGTPNYLAPERVLGQPGDSQTDIYSLGVILYELLTRHLPFQATSIAELVQKVVQDEPTPARDFAPALMAGFEPILERALAKEPQDRYETAGALAAAVGAVVDAQAAMNDTVPAPVSLLSMGAELEKPEEVQQRTSTGAAEVEFLPVADKTEPQALSDAPEPAGDKLRSPLDSDVEEVEWESAVAVVPPPVAAAVPAQSMATRLAQVGAAAVSAVRQAALSSVSAVARIGQKVPALRSRPALGAMLAFVVALPIALLVLGSAEVTAPTAPSEGDSFALARRQALGLLDESRALLEAGNVKEAQESLHQADLLFPSSPEAGRGRLLLAAEREVDRLDRIDQFTQEAHLAIARSNFTGAQNSINRLAELDAPEGTVSGLEASLRQARQRLRRARQVRAPDPPPRVVIPPRTKTRVRPAVVRPSPKTGPGWLDIDFQTVQPRGVLTVFSDGKQVLNRRYRFVEKQNFLIRKGVSGSFRERIELPEGRRSLKLYLTRYRESAQYKPITVEIPPGESITLRLRVKADGQFTVATR